MLQVQFGHAGASANAQDETAAAKNAALKDAGARVPSSFDELGTEIKRCYEELVQKGVIQPQAEVPPPAVPMDYSWARVCTHLLRRARIMCTSNVVCLQELGLIRKPASFMTSICDERGDELLYAGVPITKASLAIFLGVTWVFDNLYVCLN